MAKITEFTEAKLKSLIEKHGVTGAARATKVPASTLRGFRDRGFKYAVRIPNSITPVNPDVPEDVSRARQGDTKIKALQENLRVEAAKRKQAEEELASLRIMHESAIEASAKHSPKVISSPKSGKKSGSATAIICATDWHVEGCIEPEVVSGMNEFNLDIAAKRIDRLWKKSLYLLDFARNLSNINEIVLWLGGDLISGAIHEELEEKNFLGPTEAILYAQERVAEGIDFILKHSGIKQVRVVANHGNHGRSTKKKRVSTSKLHSWEYLSYCNLANIYKSDKRVSFQIADGYLAYADIQGHLIRFHHGDAVRFQGGVGGVTIPLRKKIAQWNKQRYAKLDVLGHFHHNIDAWDFVLSGCLCGYDAYALSIGADFQEPTQTFIVVDKRHCKVMAIPIFVEEHNEQSS